MAGDYQPPKPVGEPFRGDPKDPVPFATEGSPIVPADDAMTPWMTESALPQGPPSHAPSGPPSLAPPAQTQFRPAPKPPLDPIAAQRQRVAKFGLASGIASIFILWPLFGPIAIGLGIHSIKQGERKIGTWAISTGAAGTLIGIIVTVLVLTGVFDPDQLIQNLKKKQ